MVATVRPSVVPVCGMSAQCLRTFAALTSGRRRRKLQALGQGWRTGTALRGTPAAVQWAALLCWQSGSQRSSQDLRECTASERRGSTCAGQCTRSTAGPRREWRLQSAPCSACKLPWPLCRAAWKPRGVRLPPGMACRDRVQPCDCQAVVEGLCPVTRWVRAAVGFAVLLAAVTAAGNVWGVMALNRHVLPSAAAQASHVLQRRVELGRVRWVSPTGALGLGPLAAVGPVSVGPGPVEGSSAELPQVEVHVAAVPSLLQRRVVLRLHAPDAQVCWCTQWTCMSSADKPPCPSEDCQWSQLSSLW